jgi:hypothetical protein
MENESIPPSMIRTRIVVDSIFNMENNNDGSTINLKEKRQHFPAPLDG